ncbi:MAG: response regulator transcription factor [Bordetella sp.]|nr:response regulator transcription factor [Bordetella sp.]
MRILLVEDDAMLADALEVALRRDGARVDVARDAGTAQLALVDHDFETILLDLGLPGGSGMAILAQLRSRYDATPVIIMTARDRLSERIAGLDAGADDYLVKPFQVDELLARLRAVNRRSKGQIAPVLKCGTLVVDPANYQVTLDGETVALSSLEYRTLQALMERPGRALSRSALEQAVYGGSAATGSNTVAVYVHQLRKKLGDDCIETVHGFGYRMRTP